MERTRGFLDRNGITQTELAAGLGYEQATISRKLSGARNWKLAEVQRALIWLSERLSRPVSFDEVFGVEDVIPDDAADVVAPDPAA